MSEKHASRSQLLGLAGMLAQHMPANLSVEIAQEWMEDPKNLERFLASLRYGPFPISCVRAHHIPIRISPQRTVEEWVQAGKYGENNSSLDLTTANFSQFLTIRKDETERYETDVVAFSLGRMATIDQAKRVRQRLNLKPVGFEHLAAVGEQYPGLQRELKQLVNPDVVWVSTDSRHDEYGFVLYLGGNSDNRTFRTAIAGSSEWPGEAWFLGLSE